MRIGHSWRRSPILPLLRQNINTVPQSQQTLIDIRTFGDPFRRAYRLHLLRPSQIDNEHFCCAFELASVADFDCELLEGVGTRAVKVAVCGGEGSLAAALTQEVEDIVQGVYGLLGQLLDYGVAFGVLDYGQGSGLGHRLVGKQVPDILIVNLKEAEPQGDLTVGHLLDLLLPFDEVLVGEVADALILLPATPPKYRIGLSRARNSISEHGGVIPGQEFLHLTLYRPLIHLHIRQSLREDTIIAMRPILPLDGFVLGVDHVDGVTLHLDDAVHVAVVELAGEVVGRLGQAGGFAGGRAARR